MMSDEGEKELFINTLQARLSSNNPQASAKTGFTKTKSPFPSVWYPVLVFIED